jgi:PTS system nitrogen regulatory IIA component
MCGRTLAGDREGSVKLREIFLESQVVPALQPNDKEGVLRELVLHLCQNNKKLQPSPDRILHALLERERLGSTGVGEGVAIPHARIPDIRQLIACFGRATGGVEFDSIDQQPVTLIFVLLMPENSSATHLKALARISRLLKNESFRQHLLALPSKEAIYQAFLEEDERY